MVSGTCCLCTAVSMVSGTCCLCTAVRMVSVDWVGVSRMFPGGRVNASCLAAEPHVSCPSGLSYLLDWFCLSPPIPTRIKYYSGRQQNNPLLYKLCTDGAQIINFTTVAEFSLIFCNFLILWTGRKGIFCYFFKTVTDVTTVF